jgi:hypothetical protein
MSVEKTLKERNKRYGDFQGHANITQMLKHVMRHTAGWERLTNDKKEALEMVAHKIGRILNGDPEYKDSWHDIIGYTKLIDDTFLNYYFLGTVIQTVSLMARAILYSNS